MSVFRDRRDAGQQLAARLQHYAGRSDVVVLALPRGGVPVAFEVAQQLHAPLDVFLVRKLGVPGHEELAMGAIASGGVRVLNQDVVEELNLSDEQIDHVTAYELRELQRREHAYRDDRLPPEIGGRIVIVIDDGLATGATMRAAVAALRAQHPARLVVAVPTASADVCALLRAEVDEVICLITPHPFRAVGLWYEMFDQTSDAEVRAMLAQAYQRHRSWAYGDGQKEYDGQA